MARIVKAKADRGDCPSCGRPIKAEQRYRITSRRTRPGETKDFSFQGPRVKIEVHEGCPHPQEIGKA